MFQAAKIIASVIAVYAISGIGNVFGSLINAVTRNLGLTNQLFSYAILGFALTEAIALFGLMMTFLLLFFLI
jgi:F-type H+-transporting ATPase subunit c